MARATTEDRNNSTEVWRNVPGYGGRYQASTEGRVRKVYDTGRVRVLKPRTFSGYPTLCVRLEDNNGKLHGLSIHKIVAETFVGPLGDNVAVHKNGLYSDNSLRNLGIMTKKEFSAYRNKRAFRRAVVKIAPDGSIVDAYPSAREAARRDFVNIHAVTDRCNRQCKNEFEFTGYSYRWDK